MAKECYLYIRLFAEGNDMKTFINNPYLKLACGLILLFTSGVEVVKSFADGTIGAHHGVFIFGILQILESIPDIQESFEKIEDAKETIGNKNQT